MFIYIYVHVLLTLINASVLKRSYLVICPPSTARTEERAGGDMRFSQKHLVTLDFDVFQGQNAGDFKKYSFLF